MQIIIVQILCHTLQWWYANAPRVVYKSQLLHLTNNIWNCAWEMPGSGKVSSCSSSENSDGVGRHENGSNVWCGINIYVVIDMAIRE